MSCVIKKFSNFVSKDLWGYKPAVGPIGYNYSISEADF